VFDDKDEDIAELLYPRPDTRCCMSKWYLEKSFLPQAKVPWRLSVDLLLGKSMRQAARKIYGLSPYRDPHFSLFTEKDFRAVLDLEEARSGRSGKLCLLMLLGIAAFEQSDKNSLVSDMTRTLFSLTRETDLKGWWRTDSQIGILFTEVDVLGPAALNEAQTVIKHKILTALRARLGDTAADRITISWSVFPKSFLETERHKRP
jgi:hypothetical protein